MAFMIPVVRNDWDVWMRSGKPRPSGKSSRNNGQTTESRSDDTNLSTTPSRNGIMADTHRNKRSLAIEIRNQQHLRISGGSLPSNFQSAHVTLPLSGSSSRHRRPLNGTSRLHSMHSSYRVGKSRAFEPESVVVQDEAIASLPNSFAMYNNARLTVRASCCTCCGSSSTFCNSSSCSASSTLAAVARATIRPTAPPPPVRPSTVIRTLNRLTAPTLAHPQPAAPAMYVARNAHLSQPQVGPRRLRLFFYLD